MKDSDSRRLFRTQLILATVLLALFTSVVSGQQDPFSIPGPSSPKSIVADGNPPLTENVVDLYTKFDLWILEIPPSPLHRAMVREMLINDWNNPAAIQRDMAIAFLAADASLQTPVDREFIRADLQPKTLDSLRGDRRPSAPWRLTAYEQAHQPIAPGNPPLTESLVSRYTTYLYWLLEIPGHSDIHLTKSVRSMLIEDWKNPAEIKNDMFLLNLQIDMAHRSSEERVFHRMKIQPIIVNQLRGDMSHSVPQILVAAYDAAHPAIAAGDPPLTRQAVDAFTDMLCFTQSQGADQRPDANKALKDSYAQQFAQIYGSMAPEQRKKLTEMPQTWAALRIAWATSSEADRQKMRAQWQQTQQSGLSADPTREAVIAASVRVKAFVKRDPNTVSEQELLDAARDADAAAQECRREGSPQDLANAALWEKLALNFRGGKQAYITHVAIMQANQQIAENFQMEMLIRHSSARLNTTLNAMHGYR